MTFFSNISSLFSKARETKTTQDKQRRKQRKQTKSKETKQTGQKRSKQAKQPHSKQQAQPQKQPQQPAKPQKTQAQFQQEIAELKKKKQRLQAEIKSAKQEADSSMREARAQAREIIVEAKDEALQIKANTEREARKEEEKLNQRSRALDKKIDKIDSRLDQISRKEERISSKQQKLTKLKQSLTNTKDKMLERLEEISGMTEQEAKKVLLDGLEKKLTQDMAKLIREKEEQTQQVAKEKTKEILIDAMKHGATDYVAEYTVSIIKIPSQDVKGKIIGKSGRNIHAFERLTGVDLDLDYSDSEVRLSCFDPVRREIGRIALESLIKDGRIQPARIEKTVKKVKEEIDQVVFEAGKDLCQRAGVYNLPIGLIKTLGRFKYRFSYGQNMIKHTLEETKIGVKIAHELDLDVNVVKIGCLLHDVGKVSNNPEGSHVELGVKIAKKYNMPDEVVKCIAQHHEDEPFTGPEQMAVYIADAISGARPGARYENIEEYMERLEELEQIATSYSEVEEAYAVKAGREIRVLLNPEKSKDNDVTVLANKIKDKIENKMTYPGNVIVNVIREIRGQATAK